MADKKLDQIGKLVSRAKSVAKKYRQVTGKPLGITGEVSEYEAARILGLELCVARQPGHDALRTRGRRVTKIQIKGRRIPADAKSGQRMGSIRLEDDWDNVVLVILDEDFEPVEIHETQRRALKRLLTKRGSKSKNVRSDLSVSKFKSISQLVWSRDVDGS